MPYFEHRGFRQYFEVEGSGPPLVWAHGLYMSADKDDAFFGLFPELRKHFTLLTFDARGHGRSGFTTDPQDYRFDQLATDLLELMTHVGFGRALMMGGSMGAMTSLTCALQAPERVRALSLLQPTCVGTDINSVGRVARTLLKVIERQGILAAADLMTSIGPWEEMSRREPERVHALRDSFATQSVEAIRACSQGVTGTPFFDVARLETLRGLHIPVLMFADLSDPSHPLNSALQLEAVLPQVRLLKAPENFYYFSHCDELLREVLEFFAQAPE